MAIFAIPTSNSLPWYSQRAVLSGVTYTLEFRYNPRMARWMLQVQDSAGRALLSGIPLLPGLDVLRGHHTMAVPPGALVVYSVTKSAAPPALGAFLNDYALLYVDPTS